MHLWPLRASCVEAMGFRPMQEQALRKRGTEPFCSQTDGHIGKMLANSGSLDSHLARCRFDILRARQGM